MKSTLFLKLLTALSLFSVLVAGVSTLAWFQLDSQPLANNLVTASPDIEVQNDNVYGYKVNPVLGNNGFIDYSNTTVTRMPATSQEIITGNDNQATADTNFDVPSEGIGYYLLMKDGNGTYKYSNSGTTKFVNEYGTATRVFISSLTFEANQEVRIKRYTFENHKTVNQQVKITSVYGADSTYDAKSGDVKVATAGTYKVWLDYDMHSLGFETVEDIESKNVVNSLGAQEQSLSNNVERKVRRNNGASVTVYFAISDTDRNDRGVKLSAKLQGNEYSDSDAQWAHADLSDTGYTYNSKRIFTGSFTELYGGVGKFYFEVGTGGSKTDVAVYTSGWNSTSGFNGKMWVYQGNDWINHSTDSSPYDFYFAPSSNWNQASAKFRIECFFNNTSRGTVLASSTDKTFDGKNIFKFSVSGKGLVTQVKFIRRNNSDSGDWNSSGIISVSGDYNKDNHVKDLLVMTTDDYDSWTTSDSKSYWTNYSYDGKAGPEGYHLLGTHNSWTPTNSSLADSPTVGNNTASWTGVSLSGGDKFKVTHSDTRYIQWDSYSYGGSALDNQTYKFVGATDGDGNIVIKTGDAYTGTYNIVLNNSNKVYLTRVFTVEFNANGENVTLNTNSKTIYQSQSSYDGNTYGTLPSPTRTGYTFAGWFDAEDGGNEITSSTTTYPAGNTVAPALSLYAHWTPNPYAVTVSKSTGINSVYLSALDNATSGSASGTTFNMDSTVYAFAELKTGYNAKDGWVLVSGTANTVGAKYRVGSRTVSTSGNDFGAISANPKTFTITYLVNSDTGTGGSTSSTTFTYDAAGSIRANGFTKTGHTFAGWATSSEGGVVYSGGQSLTSSQVNSLFSSGNRTLYAKWTPCTYNITYKDGGNTDFSGTHEAGYPTTHTYGTGTTLKTASKDNYRFDGWFTNSACTGAKVTSLGATDYTDNITLFAKWTPAYTVTFNTQGHGGEVVSQGVVSGEKVIEPDPAPEETGYTFGGWFTEAECENEWDFDSDTVSSAMTLYALWTAKTYTVHIGTQTNGTLTANSTGTFDEDLTLTYSDAGATGYTYSNPVVTIYSGSTSSDAIPANVIETFSSVSSPQTFDMSSEGEYYADIYITLAYSRTANTYTIAYNLNDGTHGSNHPTSGTYDSNVQISNPSRTGYSFDGWSSTSGLEGNAMSGATSGSLEAWNGSETTNQYFKNLRNGSGTVTLVANWTPITYTITYSGMTGASYGDNHPTSANYDSAFLVNTPSKTGYNFAGWQVSSGTGKCGTADTTTTTINSTSYQYGASNTSNSAFYFKNLRSSATSVTLTATWTPKTYTVNKEVETYGTITVNASGTFASGLSISWAPQNTPGYEYPSFTLDVYTGPGKTGTRVVNNITSGTSTTYTMTGTYYENIYIRLVYTRASAVITVTLNNQSATTAGTSQIFEKYNTAYYLENECTNQMTTSEHPIPSLPRKTGYTFGGYYTEENGGGFQYIDANGLLTSNASTTKFTSSGYLYAKWTMTVKVYDPNGYIAANGNDASYYVTSTGSWTRMSSINDPVSGQTIYSAEIPSGVTFIINDKYSDWDKNVQSADLSSSDLLTYSYYVLTGISGNAGVDSTSTFSGGWYKKIISTSSNTYYYYDNANSKILGNNPKAYAWDSGESCYGANANKDNGDYPGVAMTKLSGDALTTFESAYSGVDGSYVWKIEINKSFDRVIFNDGNRESVDKTVNTTLGNNGEIFVLTGGSGTSRTGVWATKVFDITYKTSYFIKNTSDVTKQSTLSEDEIHKAFAYDTTSTTNNYASVTIDFGEQNKIDTTNGIFYHFARSDNTSTWYTDDTCSTPYSTHRLTGSTPIYAKYITDLDNYTTFYIDVSHSRTTNHADYKWDSVIATDSGGEGAYFTAPQVSPDLYRATFPNNWEIRLTNGASGYGNTSGNNWTSTIVLSNQAANSTLLHINQCAEGSNHTFTWCTYTVSSNTKYGTATVQIKVGAGAWTDIFTMQVGDGSTNNYFIYEKGYRIASGTKIQIVVTGSTVLTNKTYTYTDYNDPEQPPIYIVNDSGSIKINNAVVTGNARYNFYLTGEGKISIAMVPDYGNGYYIMNYNNSYGIDNYIGATKMNNASDTNAIYTGFYATSRTKIFIRSYIDAVDVLYTNASQLASGVTMADGEGSDPAGVLSFANPGYYNIEVSNGNIIVETYQFSDFFKLNPFDTTNKASQTAVYGQKTSIVLEIPFTCNNTYNSNISLQVDYGMLSNFVGISLYVSNTSLLVNASHPEAVYNTIRGASSPSATYSALSNSTSITDSNSLVITGSEALNNETVYYAYILIDYLYNGTYTNFPSAAYLSGKLQFHLKSTQAV